MRRPPFASLLLAALALSACASTPAPRPASPGLTELADALFASVEREGTGVGVLVVDAATGETLYTHREHARSLPASTMKVVATSAALSALGPDFRFHTPVWLEGSRLGQLFLGDLVVEASGDPSLGSWRYPETAQSCERLADALLDRGITQWHGAVQVRGANPGPQDLYGPGWAWDDAVSVYSAAPTAFVFHENVADLTLTRPEGSGCDAPPARPVEVRYTPALDASSTVVVSDPTATRGGVSCVRERGTGRTRCVWRAPGGQCARQASLRVAVDDPQALFTACLDAALEARGIQHVPVPPLEATVPGTLERELLVDFVSPSLAELVKATNKESLNLYAERLALRFTRERTGTESYAALREALEKELGRRGVSPRLLRAVDGSGLSRYNLVTARGLVTVLATSLQESYASTLVDSLPIAGVDGTLAGSTLRADLRGLVRAKTGTLSGQKGYVGLAERPHDGAHPRVLFTLLLSNFDEQPTLTTAQVFDRFAEALVHEQVAPVAGARPLVVPSCSRDEREPDNSATQVRDQSPLMHVFNHGPRPLTGLTACPGDEDWIAAHADCCVSAGAVVRWDPALGPLEVDLVDDQGAVLPLHSPGDILERRPGEARLLRAEHGGRFFIRVRSPGSVPVPYSVDVYAPVFVR